ncbi:dynamin family protein, partial [Escherichia coli]
MNKIYIEHNPFIVETHFLINGSEPAEGCKLSSYKELRLQMWVESIFEEFSRQLNGETHFSVEFKGVESDYMDILDAAEAARADGMEIEVEWLPVKEVEHRLSEIQSLMEQAKQNPQFNEYIENNESVSKGFQEAFNRDFNLYVVATMSSGKSTLINAMLGQDLLPAANEATTATIAQITDDKTVGSQFMGRRIDADSS